METPSRIDRPRRSRKSVLFEFQIWDDHQFRKECDFSATPAHAQLIAIVRDPGDLRLPDVARQVLQVLAAQLEHTEAAIAALEKQLMAWHKTNAEARLLVFGK